MFTRAAVPLPGPQAISMLEPVHIGGVTQWLSVRGVHRENPILLMVHGGPGAAQIGFIRHFQALLEQHFVVVHWDQRGAGLSYSRAVKPGTMRIEQFVADAIAVTKHVQSQLGQERVHLVGHSWGTLIGLLAVARAPELYRRYFGVSQVDSVVASERASYRELQARASTAGDTRALQQLNRIGPPPWSRLAFERVHQQLVEQYSGGITRDGEMVKRMLRYLLTSKEYTLHDLWRFMRGQLFSMRHLKEETANLVLSEVVTRVEVPTYFVMGEHDLMVPPAAAKPLFDQLGAPEKHWLMFGNSAHSPLWEQPERFVELLRSETHKDHT